MLKHIGKDLENSIINVQNSPFEYLKNPPGNSFYIFPTTANEIEHEINELRPALASGSFSMTVNILKLLRTVILKPS